LSLIKPLVYFPKKYRPGGGNASEKANSPRGTRMVFICTQVKLTCVRTISANNYLKMHVQNMNFKKPAMQYCNKAETLKLKII
jgi:hypothetical protein